MKKYCILILFLISTFCFAQNIPGKIVLNDGKELNGLLKVSFNKFVFRETKDSKVIRYGYKDAKYALLYFDDNKYMKLEFIPVKHQKKPILFNVMIQDEMSLLNEVPIAQNSVTRTDGKINPAIGVINSATFYVKKKEDEFAQYYLAVGYIPKTGFYKVIREYFTDCPELHAKVDNGEFEKKDYIEIVKFYNKNCAKDLK